MRAFESLPDQLRKELAEILKIDIQRYHSPEQIKKTLRQADAQGLENKGFNGKIDHALEFIYLLKHLPKNEVEKLINSLKFKIPNHANYQSLKSPRKLSPLALKYKEALLKLANFFMRNTGAPANATQTISNSRVAYHIYENKKTHIKPGATTSEGQVMFFGFMSACAAATQNSLCRTGTQEAHRYIRLFMSPHDGMESSNLPDQRMRNPAYTPFGLMHWLINIHGQPCGAHTNYKQYEEKGPHACFVIDPRTKQFTTWYRGKQPGENNYYKFSAALDADQWFLRWLAFSTQYGIKNNNSEIQRVLFSLQDQLVKAKNSGLGLGFSITWGAGISNGIPFGWKSLNREIYIGYQAPNVWYQLNRKKTAQKIVTLLKAAQDEYQRKYNIAGPLMPVWNKKFTWQGPDPNTPWVGFQLRMFANLAHYYYLSGDSTAKIILDKFYRWIQTEIKVKRNGKLSLPQWLDKNSGRTARSLYSPNLHGLLAQGLVYMAAKTKQFEYKQLAEELLNDLTNNRQDKTGRTKGSFPESPSHPVDPNLRFAFRQAEAGIALALYLLHLGSK